MRILSIDGGGIRGLISSQVLVELERLLQSRDGPQARIADYFDLFAGTSTGGLISCLLLQPDENGRPLRSAADLVDFYRAHGPRLFQLSWPERIRRAGGLLDERYGSGGFHKVLDDVLGGLPEDLMLSHLLRPTVIASYDATVGKPYFFKQHRSIVDGYDFLVRDVALATAAAPTQFETAWFVLTRRQTWRTPLLRMGQLGDGGDTNFRANSEQSSPSVRPLDDNERACIDGFVFANNPAMCAYAEARGWFGHTAKDMALLSIGTGTSKQTFDYRRMKNWA